MTLTVEPGSSVDFEVLRREKYDEPPGLHATEWATFKVEGTPVATWGLLLRWPHVADLCGVVSSRRIAPHVFRFARWSKNMLRDAAHRHQLRRISAYVLADLAAHRRFAEWAGFEPESVMEEAGPDGRDVIVYRRMFPWVRFSEEVETTSKSPRLRLLTTAACGSSTRAGPAKRANGSTRT